jgi:predicted dehydrogenase
MLNIAIIGAGQIGSRHLQSLATIEAATVIHLVDPSDDALRVARERFTQVRVPQRGQIELQTVQHLDAVQVPLDLAIVATSANVRADIVQQLLCRRQARYLLLEKVLFQKEADYTRIGHLLVETRIPAWVNCGYRAVGFY